MRLVRQSTDQPITLDPRAPLGSGGEARVFALAYDNEFCAKIYHEATQAQARKLAVMVANPPDDPMAAAGHISIAWPVDLLCRMYGSRQFAGFVMPRVAAMRPLFNVYNPVTRRKETPQFDYRYLHRAGRNLALGIRALHSRGYVIGDINESNILVSDTALVTLVDTDSFQVRDPDTGLVYRCPVGKPDYTPPELQNRNFRHVDRLPEHDLFGLAVLLFQLLMEGAHPYSGIYEGDGDPPPYEARILAGHFTYGVRRTPYRPMPFAPPVELLPPSLYALFLRCFEAGHSDLGARPSPQEWSAAFKESEQALTGCPDNELHWYSAHLDACPWCLRRERLGGRDPFPPESQEPMKRPPRHVPTYATSLSKAPLPSGALAAGATAAVTANLPAWPLAPTAPLQGGGRSASITIPAYHAATWVAGSMAILAVLLPGFRFLSGLIAVIFGVIGWRHGNAGRRLAALSGSIGGLVMIALLANAVAKSVIRVGVRSVTQNGAIRAITFSPDSERVVTATERTEDQRLITGQISFFSTTTGDLQRTIIGTGDMVSVTYSPDGRTLAAGTGAVLEPGKARLWDARTGALRVELTGFRGDVDAIAFSPDSRLVVTGSRDGSVTTWDAATGRLVRVMAAPGEVFGVAVSRDGRLVAAGSGSSGSGLPGHVSVWNFASGRMLWSKKAHSERAMSVAFSPDDRTLASVGSDSILRLWVPATGDLVGSLDVQGVQALSAVAFSPDGANTVTGGSDGITRLWDLRTRKVVRSFVPTDSERDGEDVLVEAVAWSRDGQFIASGGRGGTFHIWRLK